MQSPDPQNAGQDRENLEMQRRVERDRDALAEQNRRVEATAPPETRQETIGEMTQRIEREADR